MSEMDDKDDPEGRRHSTTEFHVQRAQAGDRAGFAGLFERLAQSLDAWAELKVTGSLRDFIEPRDIVQETWWRAMDAFGRYDPERSGFRPWLFTIARNILLESYRKRRRSAGSKVCNVSSRIASLPPDLARQATSVSSRFMLDESVKALVTEVIAMDEEDRRVIVHMGIEGLSSAECSALTGATVEATKKRWQRLRAKLREDPRIKEVGRWID
jgi:RNA polymerase sigma-70 factor (ECF subfamily)